MKIQMINPSKLKIIFNLDDLEENNISLHSFLSGSESSKKFLKAIIEIAEEDLDIEIPKNKFTYEAYCYNYSEFIIIVSLSKYIFDNFKKENLYFYFFDINDFLDFSDYIKSNIDFRVISSLYKYNSLFILEIELSKLSHTNLNKLCHILSETPNSFDFKGSPITITRLKEFSELLIFKNALK